MGLEQAMKCKRKRKPDVLWVLTILFGLGVVSTGYTQSLMAEHGDYHASVSTPYRTR